MIVTFFGHHDAPQNVRWHLCKVLINLIDTCGADLFYVGDKGNFDAMALSLPDELKLMKDSLGRTAKFRKKAVGWNKKIIDLLI